MACSEAEIDALVLGRFARMWEPLHPAGTPEHVAMRAEYIRQLTPWELDVLRAGVDMAMKTHRGRHWPTLAQFLTYTDKALERRSNATAARIGKPNHIRAAHDAMRLPLGQRALLEGWGYSLWALIAEHGAGARVPEEQFRKAAEFRRRWANGKLTAEERADPNHAHWVKTAAVLCEREARMIERYMEEAAA